MNKKKKRCSVCGGRFTPYIRDPRTGVIRWARDYGKRVFLIPCVCP